MCGIIGYISLKGSDAGLQYILPLLEESSIRGLHGAGISFTKGDRIVTLKEPKPFGNLKSRIDQILQLKPKSLVAHVRYSTSSFEHPQPIASDRMSVVHNGVISQEPPETWEKSFGYKDFSTSNDTEILFKLLAGDYPLEKLPDASIAACCLKPNHLVFFRNGKRPLWFTKTDDYIIVASTKDILHRSGIYSTVEVEPYYYYACYNSELIKWRSTSFGEDLQ